MTSHHPFAYHLIALIALLVPGSGRAAEREFILEARMTGDVGTSGPIAEPMAHDVLLDGHHVKSVQILKVGEKTEVTFVAKQSRPRDSVLMRYETAGDFYCLCTATPGEALRISVRPGLETTAR